MPYGIYNPFMAIIDSGNDLLINNVHQAITLTNEDL